MASQRHPVLPLRLAVYGKGGIGKSTLAANLSAAFAQEGLRVLQIGCDPKHDSTRLLLDGKCSRPVLDYLSEGGRNADLLELNRRAREKGSVAALLAEGQGLPPGLTREAVLKVGWGGVHCVEAGGPVPGVGCAGRGLLSLFTLLDLLEIRAADYDVVIYDVLGDVVCGGFAVPLRAERANRILLVTSEEYLSLYAANNLLRCVLQFDRDSARLAGLVVNRRDNDASDQVLRKLLEHSGLPRLTELPRSPVIRAAEARQRPVLDAFPTSLEAALLRKLAERLLQDTTCVAARPLPVDQLEQLCRPLPSASVQPVRAKAPTPPLPPSTEQLRLAIYGKGGIGKSTLAANLCATLAEGGKRVLFVGCDPKQDSTSLLRGGVPCRTVLEYLQDTTGEQRRLEALLQDGYCGIHCVESGGPQPGVGCAGRGILSGFTLMDKLGLEESRYDAVVYDVIGDVVCGGFALPLRKGYANAVLLVSSEEYLSLYAANVLLRGMVNMLGTSPALLGLIHNVRDNEADRSGLERFCAAVHLPLVGTLPRSLVVQKAEQRAEPITAAFPESTEAQWFRALAARVLSAEKHPPRALAEEDLERVVLGGATLDAPPPIDPHTVVPARDPQARRPRGFGRGFAFTGFEAEPAEPFFYRQPPRRQPVWGCAFSGALLQALAVRDAVVVAHGPRSCTHMRRAELAGSAAKDLKRRREFLPDPMVPNLLSTDMSEQQMIHGGSALLVDALRTALLRKPRLVFLVTACPSAIIGDDLAAAVREAQRFAPEIPIVPLRSDGNMTGGSFNGMISALFDGILEQADPRATPKDDSVNLVLDRDKTHSTQIKELLAELGIRVNATFSEGEHDFSIEQLRRFHEAPVTVVAIAGALDPMLRSYLKDFSGNELCPYSFPRGRFETERWVRWLGKRFGRQDQAERLLAQGRERYGRLIAPARSALAGKSLVVFWMGGPLEWIVDTAIDLGMKPLLVGIIAKEVDAAPFLELRHKGIVPIEFEYHPERRLKALEELRPDAVYCGPRHDLPPKAVFLDLIGTRSLGFEGGIQAARRWHALFRSPRIEGWRIEFERALEVRS